MLRPIIGEHVELRTTLDASLERVLADPGQMEQVIMNLLLNARDAMPQGGHIWVETANCELTPEMAATYEMEPGRAVTVSIRDSGHGIDASVMQHIWKPLFTTKQEGKGTGLGLSTVQQIIRECRGAVWVKSVPGEGATFTICLPCAPHSAPQSTEEPPVRVLPGSETILVAEDEAGVRTLLCHILQRRGYRVLEASNGEEAFQLYQARAGEIDLVLTDVVMPKMTGRELADRIQNMHPTARIIFMSGYTDDVLLRTGAFRPGMSFLQKPLRPEVLVAKVREALDRPTQPFNPN